jgi:hypothetical protein
VGCISVQCASPFQFFPLATKFTFRSIIVLYLS